MITLTIVAALLVVLIPILLVLGYHNSLVPAFWQPHPFAVWVFILSTIFLIARVIERVFL